MRTVTDTTTVRLAPGQREALDRVAHREGVSRAELIRRAVTLVAMLRPVPASVTAVDGARYEVRYVLPSVSASDPQGQALRNLAVIYGQCGHCDARPVVLDELPRLPTATAGPTFLPSRSPAPGSVATKTRPAPPVERITVYARFDHEAGCPAKGDHQ